jgi:hypothetical protein
VPKANIGPVRALLRHQWMQTRSTANYARPPRLVNLADGPFDRGEQISAGATLWLWNEML